MSYFNDILNAPLPSNADIFGESGDDDMDFGKDADAVLKEDGDLDFEEEDISDIFGGADEADDPDDLSDADLDSLLGDDSDDVDDSSDLEGLLNTDDIDECGNCEDGDEDLEAEGELNVGEVDGTVDNSTPPVTSVDDPTPAAPLVGDADQDADAMMAAVGTPVLLEECMTVQEAADFMESGDAEIAISEGLMMESTLNEMIEDLSSGEEAFTESVFAPANRPYKMTKKARLNQLYELSLQIEARAHHDPYVKKIDKAYAIERRIKAGWRKRYGKLAMRRAIKYLKRLQRSKSNGLKKAANQILPKK
jgi:hypothetical protein